jgi:MSHA biogenesis protein MshM
MYLDHFGLKEAPFRITPHTDFFFQGANRGATLEALLYAITHDEGIVKVSGEVGSGKTMLCRVLMERLPATVETIYLVNPSLSRDEILLAIADELGLELEGSRTTRVLRALQDHLIRLFGEGRRVVVLIDEAHAMPNETLEEVRLLSNLESNRHKLLQLVLFGQPELDERLDTVHMRQLKERITQNFRLEPLVRSDIENYIDFRMRAAGYRGPKVFAPKAIKLVTDASRGLTRRINILADKSLLAAFAGNTHEVSEVEVKMAVKDSEFHRSPFKLHKAWVVATALATGLIFGWGVNVLLSAGVPGVSAPVLPVANTVALKRASNSGGPQPSSAAQSAVSIAPAEPNSISIAPAEPKAGAGPVVSAFTAPPQQVSAADSSAVAPAVPAKEVPAESIGPTPPARGQFTRERFAATQEWLKTAPEYTYVVQLVTVNSSELGRLEDFLLKAAKVVPAEGLLVYSVIINGQQYYRAGYGSYASAADAQVAINQLPPLFAPVRPYYRSVERIRSQNRQRN